MKTQVQHDDFHAKIMAAAAQDAKRLHAECDHSNGVCKVEGI